MDYLSETIKISLIIISVVLLSLNVSDLNVSAQQSGSAKSGNFTTGPFTANCAVQGACVFGPATSGPATSGSVTTGPSNQSPPSLRNITNFEGTKFGGVPRWNVTATIPVGEALGPISVNPSTNVVYVTNMSVNASFARCVISMYYQL